MTDPRTPAADISQDELIAQLRDLFGVLEHPDLWSPRGLTPLDTAALARLVAQGPPLFPRPAGPAPETGSAGTAALPARPPAAGTAPATAYVRDPYADRGSGSTLQQGGVPPVAALLAPTLAEGAVPITRAPASHHRLLAAVQAEAAAGERPATRRGSAEPERRGRAAGVRVGARVRALRAARPVRWLLTAAAVAVAAVLIAGVGTVAGCLAFVYGT